MQTFGIDCLPPSLRGGDSSSSPGSVFRPSLTGGAQKRASNDNDDVASAGGAKRAKTTSMELVNLESYFYASLPGDISVRV